MKTLIFGLSLVALIAWADAAPKHALVDLKVAQEKSLPILHSRPDLGLAVVKLRPEDMAKLSKHMHSQGRCGGYELVDAPKKSFFFFGSPNYDSYFTYMSPATTSTKNIQPVVKFSQEIAEKVDLVSTARLREYLTWISSYETRFHSGEGNNAHVEEMKRKLEKWIQDSGRTDVKVDLVSHRGTGQKTVRARILGSSKPDEIVVLGAHFDSINQYGFLEKAAPGADDDGSGSANLMETFHILLGANPPARTVEFLWYAAEEIGLVGSSEVAQEYRSSGKQVISALQLDMTLFPGSGQLKITFMTDFTSAPLTSYLEELNSLYVRAAVAKDRCGYGCSDHASWHRQGFAAAMPFEASMSQMNRNIHTKNDVISTALSFEHSAAFNKLAVAYILSVANSDVRF